MLVLAAVWWAWGGYAWLTNALHSDDGLARFGLLAAMAAMLIAALAVPGAFGDDAVVFGIAYFAVRAIHIAVYTYGAPAAQRPRRDPSTSLPGLLPAPALLIVAGFLDGGAASRALDRRPADRLRHPLPARRRAASGLARALPERFGLIVIIALGESIVATRRRPRRDRAQPPAWSSARSPALVLAGAQWWAYFDVVALVAERTLRERRGRGADPARARLLRASCTCC